MRRIMLLAVLAVLVCGSVNADTAIDWTRYGFTAEPGAAVGTPCVLNLMARFWYRNFGISTCGLYLPEGVNFLRGSGLEANVMYRLLTGGKRRTVVPYVALGYGNASVSSTATGTTIALSMNYVGVQVGAYYSGAFAQLGVGAGRFRVNTSSPLTVFPLLQIGYNFSTRGTSGTSGGGSSGGSGGTPGGGSSGGGTK